MFCSTPLSCSAAEQSIGKFALPAESDDEDRGGDLNSEVSPGSLANSTELEWVLQQLDNVD